MSKYIQAYEAGVKLAYQSFFDKLAEEPNMSIDPNEQYYDESAGMSIDPSQEPPAEQPPQEASYSFSDTLNSPGNYLGDAYTNYVRPALNWAMGEIPPEQRQGQQAPAQAQAQAPAQATPSTEQPSNGTAASGSGGFGLTLDPTMQNLRASYDFNNTPAQAPAQAPAAQQAQPQATPAPEPELEGPPAPLNFQAVRGGYGKQLAALRNMKGLSDEDIEVLQNSSYRDLAGAMGNRGLRVGDTFDANALITRMRHLRSAQDQPGSMSGVDMPTIDIQNRRGRDVNRGSLAAMQQRIQRAGAARPAVGNQPMRSVASPMANTGRMSMPSSLPSSANYGNAGTTGTDGGQSEFQKYLQSGKSYPGGR